MPDIYCVNGKFVERDSAVISIEDRGFQFGDGLYEVVRSYGGQLFCLDEHIERLESGLNKLGFESTDILAAIKASSIEALHLSEYKEAFIYIQVTRGTAKRSHVIPKGLIPNFFVIVYKLPFFPEKEWEEGIKVKLVPDIRWLLCSIKSIQLLPNCLAKTISYEDGCAEAIMHRDGIVTEAASSNVFIVKDNIIKTHPADETILHGVTRKLIIDLCKNNSFSIREEKFTVDELMNADEVFIVNTGDEVKPVVVIEGSLVGNGLPGPVAKELLRLFRELT